MVEFLNLLIWGPVVVSLTFDDGGTKVTERLLDMLDARNIPATFFINCWQVDEHPGVYRRIIREGHEIGNHSCRHLKMDKLPEWRVRREISDLERRIGKVKYYRPPFGERKHLRYLKGYRVILWDWSSGDAVCQNEIQAGKKSASDCIREVRNRLRYRGEGIGLFHDCLWWTSRAIREYLDRPEIVFVSLGFYDWYRDLKFGKKIIAWAAWAASRIGVRL